MGITGLVYQNKNTVIVNEMNKATKYNPDIDNFNGASGVKNLMFGCMIDEETDEPVGVL